jgi:hypothetical protein
MIAQSLALAARAKTTGVLCGRHAVAKLCDRLLSPTDLTSGVHLIA